MTPKTTDFEADLHPQTGAPRIRLNFSNGWSASIVLRNLTRGDGTRFDAASLACCPTGEWLTGQTVLAETEASAEEVAEFLAEVASRSRLQ